MSEHRWTYVTPADGLNRVLHLPGCRMMTETERLGRVRAVESYDGRDPMTLGDLLCQHCRKRVDKLPEIKTRWLGDALHRPEYWADQASHDVPWLIAEVERLRTRT